MSEEILETGIVVGATSYKKGSRAKGGEWHKYSLKSYEDVWFETFDNDVAWEGGVAWKDIQKGDELILRYVVTEKNGYTNNIIKEILDPQTYDSMTEEESAPAAKSDLPFGNPNKKDIDWGVRGPAENPAKPVEVPTNAAPASKPTKPAKPKEQVQPPNDQSEPPMARCIGEALDYIQAIQKSLPDDVRFSADSMLTATVHIAAALYIKEVSRG
jgi:hypothetical protein